MIHSATFSLISWIQLQAQMSCSMFSQKSISLSSTGVFDFQNSSNATSGLTSLSAPPWTTMKGVSYQSNFIVPYFTVSNTELMVLSLTLYFWNISSFQQYSLQLGFFEFYQYFGLISLSSLGRKNSMNQKKKLMRSNELESWRAGFKAGAIRIVPLNICLCFRLRWQATAPPRERPRPQKGTEGQISLVSLMNFQESAIRLSKLSIYPLNPSDLPQPLKSYPTVIIFLDAKYFAKCALRLQ